MASEVTIRRFIRALLEKKGDDPMMPAEKLEKPEAPLKLSWSWGEHMMVCSEPRELAVKYATVLKSMRFKPGKKGYDHCWIKDASDRYRYTEKLLRAFANKLVAAGANVEIEFQGKTIPLTDEVEIAAEVRRRSKRPLREVFGRKGRRGAN